eukprot:scaffold482_cov247-Pinguiococcus_pyrenoidosus.AAC.14
MVSEKGAKVIQRDKRRKASAEKEGNPLHECFTGITCGSGVIARFRRSVVQSLSQVPAKLDHAREQLWHQSPCRKRWRRPLASASTLRCGFDDPFQKGREGLQQDPAKGRRRARDCAARRGLALPQEGSENT